MPRSSTDTAGISGSGTPLRTVQMPCTPITPARAPGRFPGRRRCTWWRARAAAAALQLLGRGQSEARARHAERMAERDRAAVGVHMRRVVGEAELAHHGEALGGEGFVQFDHVDVADLEAEPFEQAQRRGRRADAHDPRRDAGDGRAEDFGARGQAVFLRGCRRCDDQSGGAVVDPRGIAGGDGAAFADDRFQLGERFDAGQARMLVTCRR